MFAKKWSGFLIACAFVFVFVFVATLTLTTNAFADYGCCSFQCPFSPQQVGGVGSQGGCSMAHPSSYCFTNVCDS